MPKTCWTLGQVTAEGLNELERDENMIPCNVQAIIQLLLKKGFQNR